MRLLIVDDHRLFRSGLRQLLEMQSGLLIVGEASSAEDAAQVLRNTPVDVILLDISLPTVNGIAALEMLWRIAPRVKVLMLSAHKDSEYVARALAAGVSGYLLKESASPEEVTMAVRAAVKGEMFVSPALTHLLVKPFVQQSAPGEPLTARQRQVLVLLAQGLTVKQAAARLHLGVKTVETHRAVLMERLGLKTVASLVLYAIRQGLISAADK
ncbi:MAG: response regulator transcription factor [Rhizobacter sp.]